MEKREEEDGRREGGNGRTDGRRTTAEWPKEKREASNFLLSSWQQQQRKAFSMSSIFRLCLFYWKKGEERKERRERTGIERTTTTININQIYAIKKSYFWKWLSPSFVVCLQRKIFQKKWKWFPHFFFVLFSMSLSCFHWFTHSPKNDMMMKKGGVRYMQNKHSLWRQKREGRKDF